MSIRADCTYGISICALTEPSLQAIYELSLFTQGRSSGALLDPNSRKSSRRSISPYPPPPQRRITITRRQATGTDAGQLRPLHSSRLPLRLRDPPYGQRILPSPVSTPSNPVRARRTACAPCLGCTRPQLSHPHPSTLAAQPPNLQPRVPSRQKNRSATIRHRWGISTSSFRGRGKT